MKPNANAPKLEPTLGFVTVALLVVSSIIGSGVFKKVAPMSEDLGSPTLVLLCWGLAGLVTLLGALGNAEVAGLIADSGGQYVYFKKMYGKFFAFLYGWASFAVIQCATTASVAYVFSQSIHAIWPLPGLPEHIASITLGGGDFIFTPFDNFGVKLLTIGLIVLLSVINYRGVKYGGFITNVFASTVVVAIFGIIIAGLASSSGEISHIQQTVGNQDYTTFGLLGLIFAGMRSAFWAYEGWNNVGFIGGEIKDPKRTLPRALTFGVIFVIITYLLINFVYLYISPIGDIIAEYQADENSIAAISVASKILGSWGGGAIAILILIATFNCTNSTILTAPRIYYAMAKDKLFFRGAEEVHPTFHTPSKSIVIAAIWSSVLVLSGSFDQLTDMLVFAAFIFYGAGALGVFVLRKKMKDAERSFKVNLIIPAIFVLFCIVLVVVTLIENPRDAGIGLVLILAGLPFYFFWNRRSETEGILD